MKKLLTVSKGEHFAARLLRTMAVLLIGLGLGLAFWTATAPVVQAQDPSANFVRSVEQELPEGSTMASASKQQLVDALCAAIRKRPQSAPQLARVAAAARPEWNKDIMRAAFRCAPEGNCALLGRIYRAMVDANPDDASELNALAVRLAPDCASSFGGEPGEDEGEGAFGGGPGNQNPPPGSIGGGGAGQGGRCQVCHVEGGTRRTLTVSCNAVPLHLGHGDTEGPCPVTPTQNP